MSNVAQRKNREIQQNGAAKRRGEPNDDDATATATANANEGNSSCEDEEESSEESDCSWRMEEQLTASSTSKSTLKIPADLSSSFWGPSEATVCRFSLVEKDEEQEVEFSSSFSLQNGSSEHNNEFPVLLADENSTSIGVDKDDREEDDTCTSQGEQQQQQQPQRQRQRQTKGPKRNTIYKYATKMGDYNNCNSNKKVKEDAKLTCDLTKLKPRVKEQQQQQLPKPLHNTEKARDPSNKSKNNRVYLQSSSLFSHYRSNFGRSLFNITNHFESIPNLSHPTLNCCCCCCYCYEQLFNCNSYSNYSGCYCSCNSNCRSGISRRRREFKSKSFAYLKGKAQTNYKASKLLLTLLAVTYISSVELRCKELARKTSHQQHSFTSSCGVGDVVRLNAAGKEGCFLTLVENLGPSSATFATTTATTTTNPTKAATTRPIGNRHQTSHDNELLSLAPKMFDHCPYFNIIGSYNEQRCERFDFCSCNKAVVSSRQVIFGVELMEGRGEEENGQENEFRPSIKFVSRWLVSKMAMQSRINIKFKGKHWRRQQQQKRSKQGMSFESGWFISQVVELELVQLVSPSASLSISSSSGSSSSSSNRVSSSCKYQHYRARNSCSWCYDNSSLILSPHSNRVSVQPEEVGGEVESKAKAMVDATEEAEALGQLLATMVTSKRRPKSGSVRLVGGQQGLYLNAFLALLRQSLSHHLEYNNQREKQSQQLYTKLLAKGGKAKQFEKIAQDESCELNWFCDEMSPSKANRREEKRLKLVVLHLAPFELKHSNLIEEHHQEAAEKDKENNSVGSYFSCFHLFKINSLASSCSCSCSSGCGCGCDRSISIEKVRQTSMQELKKQSFDLDLGLNLSLIELNDAANSSLSAQYQASPKICGRFVLVLVTIVSGGKKEMKLCSEKDFETKRIEQSSGHYLDHRIHHHKYNKQSAFEDERGYLQYHLLNRINDQLLGKVINLNNNQTRALKQVVTKDKIGITTVSLTEKGLFVEISRKIAGLFTMMPDITLHHHFNNHGHSLLSWSWSWSWFWSSLERQKTNLVVAFVAFASEKTLVSMGNGSGSRDGRKQLLPLKQVPLLSDDTHDDSCSLLSDQLLREKSFNKQQQQQQLDCDTNMMHRPRKRYEDFDKNSNNNNNSSNSNSSNNNNNKTRTRHRIRKRRRRKRVVGNKISGPQITLQTTVLVIISPNSPNSSQSIFRGRKQLLNDDELNLTKKLKRREISYQTVFPSNSKQHHFRPSQIWPLNDQEKLPPIQEEAPNRIESVSFAKGNFHLVLEISHLLEKVVQFLSASLKVWRQSTTFVKLVDAKELDSMGTTFSIAREHNGSRSGRPATTKTVSLTSSTSKAITNRSLEQWLILPSASTSNNNNNNNNNNSFSQQATPSSFLSDDKERPTMATNRSMRRLKDKDAEIELLIAKIGAGKTDESSVELQRSLLSTTTTTTTRETGTRSAMGKTSDVSHSLLLLPTNLTPKLVPTQNRHRTKRRTRKAIDYQRKSVNKVREEEERQNNNNNKLEEVDEAAVEADNNKRIDINASRSVIERMDFLFGPEHDRSVLDSNHKVVARAARNKVDEVDAAAAAPDDDDDDDDDDDETRFSGETKKDVENNKGWRTSTAQNVHRQQFEQFDSDSLSSNNHNHINEQSVASNHRNLSPKIQLPDDNLSNTNYLNENCGNLSPSSSMKYVEEVEVEESCFVESGYIEEERSCGLGWSKFCRVTFSSQVLDISSHLSTRTILLKDDLLFGPHLDSQIVCCCKMVTTGEIKSNRTTTTTKTKSATISREDDNNNYKHKYNEATSGNIGWLDNIWYRQETKTDNQLEIESSPAEGTRETTESAATTTLKRGKAEQTAATTTTTTTTTTKAAAKTTTITTGKPPREERISSKRVGFQLGRRLINNKNDNTDEEAEKEDEEEDYCENEQEESGKHFEKVQLEPEINLTSKSTSDTRSVISSSSSSNERLVNVSRSNSSPDNSLVIAFGEKGERDRNVEHSTELTDDTRTRTKEKQSLEANKQVVTKANSAKAQHTLTSFVNSNSAVKAKAILVKHNNIKKAKSINAADIDTRATTTKTANNYRYYKLIDKHLASEHDSSSVTSFITRDMIEKSHIIVDSSSSSSIGSSKGSFIGGRLGEVNKKATTTKSKLSVKSENGKINSYINKLDSAINKSTSFISSSSASSPFSNLSRADNNKDRNIDSKINTSSPVSSSSPSSSSSSPSSSAIVRTRATSNLSPPNKGAASYSHEGYLGTTHVSATTFVSTTTTATNSISSISTRPPPSTLLLSSSSPSPSSSSSSIFSSLSSSASSPPSSSSLSAAASSSSSLANKTSTSNFAITNLTKTELTIEQQANNNKSNSNSISSYPSPSMLYLNNRNNQYENQFEESLYFQPISIASNNSQVIEKQQQQEEEKGEEEQFNYQGQRHQPLHHHQLNQANNNHQYQQVTSIETLANISAVVSLPDHQHTSTTNTASTNATPSSHHHHHQHHHHHHHLHHPHPPQDTSDSSIINNSSTTSSSISSELSSITSITTNQPTNHLETILYLMSNLSQTFDHSLPIALILGLIILVTFVGNILVCLSVIKVRKLRHPSNYLIISLAISDLCVACVVMPFGLYQSINDKWQLGRLLCNVYVVSDVTSCTASILNLCIISIDRYLAITRPLTYCVERTTRLMLILIALVWLLACLISVPPLIISGNEYGTLEEPKCEVNQSLWYQLYATCVSFYIPLIVMICLYYNIYTAAKRVVETEKRATNGLLVNIVNFNTLIRERKASITLGVIMSAFTICWLPFFIIALLRPFSEAVNNLPRTFVLLTLWLGYANSLLNPIIYVTFHHDFRNAFKHLLCFRCMTINEHIRKDEYKSQYGETHYQENIRKMRNQQQLQQQQQQQQQQQSLSKKASQLPSLLNF